MSEGEKKAVIPAIIGSGDVKFTPKLTINFYNVAYAFKKGYRYCTLEGSSRSGKTWAVMQWIVFACLQPRMFIKDFERDYLEVRCLRHDATTAADTIWDDVNKILHEMGVVSGKGGFSANLRDKVWTFPNGSKIMFGGASDPGKLHGLGQDVVFFNEAMMIQQAALDQMEMRTRVGFILDWNPSLNEHWVFKQGFDKITVYGEDERNAGEPKCFYSHSTYKDNPYLSAGQIAGIEKYEVTDGNIARGTANRHMWEIYGLGKRGYLEGRIIQPERVEIVGADEFPTSKQWEVHGYGLDWGFVDPTAVVECAIWNKKLYVRELLYKTGLVVVPDPTLPEAESAIGYLKEMAIKPTEIIVADSARADLNKALRNAGFCVLDAYKPGGSLENGINLMNQRKWCVTDDSYNLKFELENWCWAKDRYGRTLNVPGKKHNHLMDAVRYWLTTFVDSGNTVRIEEEGRYSARDEEQEWSCPMEIW